MKKIDNNLLYIILEEIKNNKNITEEELSQKYAYSERTIRRYIKKLKDQKIIKLVGNGIKKEWHIL